MNETFDRILVPVDFTEKNDRAIAFAIQLAKQHDSRLHLLHIVESLDLPDDAEVQRFMESMEQKSAAQLKRLQDRFADENLELVTDTVVGHRGRGIVQYAIDNSVELIVMSSHRIEPSARKDDWATISYQVSLVCPCSIMLIKSE